jgi:hypothetical protein
MKIRNMNVSIQLKPMPSKYKTELQALKITAGAVARYVGLSYNYVLNQLNGVYPMTSETKRKIRTLIRTLKFEKAHS